MLQHTPNRKICPGRELSDLDLDFQESGTRFRLFAQSPVLHDYPEPETVWISLPPDQIAPGPNDARMYVVDAIEKQPYGDHLLPPYDGAVYPPARPGMDGHFDHLEVGSHQFEAAHMYGVMRWVLDIWQGYLGGEIEWSFKSHYDRLELVPWLDWDNAHAGYGFVETGYGRDDAGNKFPYNLNFDVLAHEFGHTMLYSLIGLPLEGEASTAFFAYHETAADMVAILSLLHFDSVVDRILDQTSGDIYSRNKLNRLGEESETRQIRMASNDVKMRDVADVRTPMSALTNKQLHDISVPLTGALFDLLTEIFQHNLVDRGLIPAALDESSRGLVEHLDNQLEVQTGFDLHYRGNEEQFKKSLIDARDSIGLMMAHSWSVLGTDLDFKAVVDALFDADFALSGGHYHPEIEQVFSWREIPF